MFSRKLLVLSFSALILSSVPAFAKMGTESGGGGDASEIRVDEIRADILNWINLDGPRGLVLPGELSYGEYVDKMTAILKEKKVAVEFTDKEVKVEGALKTCKGFTSDNNLKHHILCNISRFKNTPDSEQYKLIHHEYAGLVNVERNEGPVSDYVISSQITDFLSSQKVLKLSVKKNQVEVPDLLIQVNNFADEYYPDFITTNSDGSISISKPGIRYNDKEYDLEGTRKNAKMVCEVMGMKFESFTKGRNSKDRSYDSDKAKISSSFKISIVADSSTGPLMTVNCSK